MKTWLEYVVIACNLGLGYIVYDAAHHGHWDVAAGICVFLVLDKFVEFGSKLFDIYLRLGRFPNNGN